MDQELLRQIAAIVQENNAAILEHIEAEGNRTRREIMTYIETRVEKRIDSLFDAYVGTQERVTRLQGEVDRLRDRMQALEDLVKSMAS